MKMGGKRHGVILQLNDKSNILNYIQKKSGGTSIWVQCNKYMKLANFSKIAKLFFLNKKTSSPKT
jgi:hypothetical protein